jgi:hypothetical protein
MEDSLPRNTFSKYILKCLGLQKLQDNCESELFDGLNILRYHKVKISLFK